MWLWLLIPVAGFVALLLVVVCAVALWGYLQFREIRAFKEQPDTHDLRSRVERMAEDYLAKRPHGALVIGVIQNGQFRSLGSGRISSTNDAPPDEQTLFEIGSVTKVFTGVALAQMVNDGRLELNDTIQQHLPSDVALPAEAQAITLVQLATHTAGLPRLPDNLDLSDANAVNPYARYTSRELYEYLRGAKLRHAPGSRLDYSNLGAGVLGHVLERHAGKTYEQVVIETVCAPLGMANTAIALSGEQLARLAPGHDRRGNVVSNWDFDVLAPAGALRSSAADLLVFIEANLATNHPTLGPALRRAQEVHFKSLIGTQGLGWQILDVADGWRFHWHNGGTGGYVSFIGFDRAHQTGVVLLSNTGDAMAGDPSLDKMGMDLLKLVARVSWE